MKPIHALLLLLAAHCSVPLAAAPSPVIAALERLAAAGNAEAKYHLGMSYHVGSGVERDRVKALAYFRQAAALGDPLGAYKLGCYYDGQGEGLVRNDAAQALRYKRIAAEAGYALAQQDVASLLARAGDTTAALAWVERSAAQGWAGGLMMMASAHNGAPGVPRDPAKTAAYFRLFLARQDGTAEQRAWLQSFEAKLSQADRERAAAIVRDYRAAPTALTIKALSGHRAAEALVARS